MNTLKEVALQMVLRMRSRSDEVMRQLHEAMACAFHLHDRGCIVLQITVRHDYAVIEIDKPAELQGALKVTRINGRYREVVRVTRLMGCQVEWTERGLLTPLQREV